MKNQNTQMRAVDLFCGCGGLTSGLERAGISVVAAYDAWPAAVECYNQNFTHSAECADLSNVRDICERIAAHNPDIIVGGPPCQDFSSAGKRTEGLRADLTRCYAQIVKKIRPTWFVMENVDRAVHSATYRAARKLLAGAGYGMTEEILNAKNFGVPQNRRRFFCIGLLGAENGFLRDGLKERESATPITVRQYFQRIRRPIDINHYYRHPRNYTRRAVFSVDELAPTIRGVNRPVPGGYTGHAGDTHDTRDVRPLTSRERAMVQTFPAKFKLPETKTVTEMLIGNAVPVKLGSGVAGAILAHS